MTLFGVIVVLHVLAGATGLIAFWAPILSRKGGKVHRRWGDVAARALMTARGLAIAMALLSLYGPEQRLPMIKDRALFAGLFGWMMLYLGLLTIGFADYGLAVARYRGSRAELRGVRHQALFLVVMAAAINCGGVGFTLGQPLMMLVAVIGGIAMATQLFYIWAPKVESRAYVSQHFRSLLGMGISAYTAFLSVGLIRLVPDHVFSPVIWAVPSIIGVSLIIVFTLRTAPRRKVSAASGR